MPIQVCPALFCANYHEAKARLDGGLVTGSEIRSWFAVWALDKAHYGYYQGQPCGLQKDDTWLPIDWIINAP